MNRLENVTRRLEKIHCTNQTQDTAVQTNILSPKKSTPASNFNLETLEQNSSTLFSTLHLKSEIILNQSTNMSIVGYEDLLSGPVKKYLELSHKIGGDVATHSKLVEKAFQLVFPLVKISYNQMHVINK